MEYRALGQTGINTSVLGLGTVKFGRNQQVKYPQAFELPSDKEIVELLALAADLGINTLDTAPAYGSREERLGKLLPQRQKWVLISKAGEEFHAGQSQFDFSPTALEASVKRSLKRLNTDYLDIVLIHSDGNDIEIIEQDRALDSLARLKQAGLIRAFGISTKTLAGGLLALQQSDVVMAACHPQALEDLPILKAAQEQKKGILIKKALQSGHIDAKQPGKIAEQFKFILKQPAVSSIIIGTLNPKHLQENVASL